MTAVSPGVDAVPLRDVRSSRRGDRVFSGLTLVAGALVFALLGAIAIFLIVKALPALRHDKSSFWTTKIWDPDGSGRYGVASLVFGTVLSSVLALVMAVPVALGVAVYTVEYAPRRVGRILGYLTDMLAAVPSVVYGLWGLFFLLPHLIGTQVFLNRWAGWIPLFGGPHGDVNTFSKSVFAASVILAIMVLPIVAAISREVIGQVDPAQKEAALALGATRWEMLRLAVFPPSRPGIVSAVMLGLGRALGETIAVALVIGNTFDISAHVLTPGGNTIAANIANRFGEAGNLGVSALIASGLVLFVITLLVNLIARYVIYRSGLQERSAAV
ncbi:MAG: phosphate ABC transporter permease subunit PstC [Frankiaceae bacterium]|nr:phosphate ABC transporter permease subunit PstC [Frankiaceae bacterium]